MRLLSVQVLLGLAVIPSAMPSPLANDKGEGLRGPAPIIPPHQPLPTSAVIVDPPAPTVTISLGTALSLPIIPSHSLLPSGVDPTEPTPGPAKAHQPEATPVANVWKRDEDDQAIGRPCMLCNWGPHEGPRPTTCCHYQPNEDAEVWASGPDRHEVVQKNLARTLGLDQHAAGTADGASTGLNALSTQKHCDWDKWCYACSDNGKHCVDCLFKNHNPDPNQCIEAPVGCIEMGDLGCVPLLSVPH